MTKTNAPARGISSRGDVAPANPLSDKLLTRGCLREFIPVSDMTLFRWIRDGKFPRPIMMSRQRYWKVSEVNAWLEKHSAARAA